MKVPNPWRWWRDRRRRRKQDRQVAEILKLLEPGDWGEVTREDDE